MKDILSALAGKNRIESPMCEAYRNIKTTKNLTDLIVLASIGKCGGDTTDSAFRFNISVPQSLEIVTDTTSDYFCGERKYEVGGLNYTLKFGDTELYYTSSITRTNSEDTCGISSGYVLWNNCVSDDRTLVIDAPNYFSDLYDCGSYDPHGNAYWCYGEGGLYPDSHVTKFGLAPMKPSLGTWAIKRMAEDTVICRIKNT